MLIWHTITITHLTATPGTHCHTVEKEKGGEFYVLLELHQMFSILAV